MEFKNNKFSVFPFYVTFCITSKCNAKCVHCSSGLLNGTKNDLSTDKILSIIEELSNCGVLQIGLSGGEPLLHPDFKVIAKKIIDLGMVVGIGTNGSFINQETIDLIKEIGIHRVQISLDGNCEDTHDSFRGVKGLFEKALKAIEDLVKSNIEVKVCMTPTRRNYRELEGLIDRCAQMGVNGFNLSQFVPVGMGSKDLDLESEEWKNILELWYRKSQEYNKKMYFTSHEAQLILIDNSLSDNGGFQGCQAGYGVGCIKADGTVIPCVMLDKAVGNIKENTFYDIWTNSDILKQLRDKSNYKMPCKDCSFLQKCGGCRGVAYGLSGDYLAGDPRCWLHN
jgi:radical SAM protein with 4Fe4S-binding SPASM domain